MVYTSRHLSLAVLEVLVHVELVRDLPDDHRYWEIELKERDVERLDPERLNGSWARQLEHTRELGNAWLESGRSLGLLVPSAVVPIEDNLLLNPRHDRIDALEVRNTRDFTFDARLANL